MGGYMKANPKMVEGMVKAPIYIQINHNMRANTKMVKGMDKESIQLPMEIVMRVSGKKG